jgi:hypothetical protein
LISAASRIEPLAALHLLIEEAYRKKVRLTACGMRRQPPEHRSCHEDGQAVANHAITAPNVEVVLGDDCTTLRTVTSIVGKARDRD